MKPGSLLSVALFVFFFCSLCLLPSCIAGNDDDSRLGMVVSILPQAEFAEAVGGERVRVTVMVPPGANPHTYEVTPSQMALLGRAKLYAKVGTPIEFEVSWMDKLISINKNMLVVDCSSGITLMESQDVDEHSSIGVDPHIWVSLKNTAVMVRNICEGLKQVDPANKAYYEKGRDEYLVKLAALDKEIGTSLRSLKKKSFIVYHPAFGYFARDYGLTQVAVEEEGKEPTARYLQRIIEEARRQDVKIVFISPQYSSKSAELIAREIGGSVVAVDSLPRDYLETMKKIGVVLKEAMR